MYYVHTYIGIFATMCFQRLPASFELEISFPIHNNTALLQFAVLHVDTIVLCEYSSLLTQIHGS